MRRRRTQDPVKKKPSHMQWIRKKWHSLMGKVFSAELEVSWGSDTPGSLPARNLRLEPLMTQVVGTYTGPDEGLAAKNGVVVDISKLRKPIAGSMNWTRKHELAYGMAVSLYDHPPGREHPQGHPVADVFGVAVYPNSCVIALADGVNWGEKARLAARCAVRGAMERIHKDLYAPPNALRHATLDTHVVTRVVLSAFGDAQDAIIKSEATMTTLCVAVVCRLLHSDTGWAVVTVNVGDSYAYIYSPTTGRVREVTVGSHPEERDMRDSGGVLGPADGLHPDLSNLTCSVTTISTGDVVFLLSDGVTDNFDPVVLRKSTTEKEKRAWRHLDMPEPDLPIWTREERESFQCRKMEDALRQPTLTGQRRTAREVCAALIGYSTERTNDRRRLLEEPDNQTDLWPPKKRRERMDELERVLKRMSGKLDHAAAVAYTAREIPLTAVERRAHVDAQLYDDLANF
ncbi:PP2C-like domain-containing protein CG9801 isoform X1 [Oscarella lobularis]|uniref:PP2C-like domain-containing protein CG9801 isoform X1 n=2 Tax=Oscarella lobularis TaxID=121494 RepID=UPI0033131533